MENANLIESRKKAYEYIKYLVGRVSTIPEHLTDEVTYLADGLSGKFGLKDALKNLKEGKTDPTEQLKKAVKNFDNRVQDSEIDRYLVDPFPDKS